MFFLERSLNIVRFSGRIGLLTPNKWFRANYASSLRAVLIAKARIHLLVDFGHSRDLFPDADTFPAAVVFEPVASMPNPQTELHFVRAHDSDRQHHTLTELLRNHYIIVPHCSLKSEQWRLEDRGVSDLLSRLMQTGIPLSRVLKRPILSGLKTGFNEAFYINSCTRDALVAQSPECAPLLKRFLRGRDIHRWSAKWDNQWHIVIPSSQNRKWPWSDAHEADAETIFAELYPSLHQHLKPFEGKLKSRQDKGRFWWELRACDYYDEFAKPKIVVQCIAYFSQYALDTDGYTLNNKAILIPSDDPYLLAILNSQIIWWITWRTFQHMKDEGLSVDVQYLKPLPVPTPPDNLREEIRSTALRVIEAQNESEDIEQIYSLELRLNDLVEEAFQVTDDERSVLQRSLPLRDPLMVLRHKVSGDSKAEEAANHPTALL